MLNEAKLNASVHDIVNLRFAFPHLIPGNDRHTHHGITQFRAVTHQA